MLDAKLMHSLVPTYGSRQSQPFLFCNQSLLSLPSVEDKHSQNERKRRVKKSGQHLLGDSPEVGQEVLGDCGDELFGRVVQKVALQHIQEAVQGPHAAGQVGAAKGCLQQAAHGLCDDFVLGAY